jgi:hypothetical protein
VTYETARESWHVAAVIGHTRSSKIFPFSAMDANMLQTRNILTISQRLVVNDLTVTTDENRALFDELATFHQLQYKLRLLVCTMRHAPVADKFMAHNTMASSLFAWIGTSARYSRNNNGISFKKRCNSRLHM